MNVVPPEFGKNWEKLLTLDLSGNNLKQIDDSFGTSWKKLMFLYLFKNPSVRLTLSDARSKWPELTKLSI